MQTAVIYARYSCDKQTEQSIEGQLRVCKDYAKAHDILILETYIDQAMSGTNDNRPDFQRMLKDSSRHEWNYVLVYKLDRFSRNKFEATIHKKTLKDNGVKVVSVMENIPDTPEGIILESLLEGMNQYYSAELAQKVSRGMKETRRKGYFQGGNLLFGYKIDGRRIILDETNSEIVRYIYDEFSKGICVRKITERLTERGILRKGKPFNMNTVYNILRNEKYTGTYRHGDEVVDNMYPQIISQDVFEKVKAKLTTYRHGKNSIKIDYLLRAKLKCGYCGQTVIGESGTAKSGIRKYYYKCRGRKNKITDCHLSVFRKEWLEKVIVDTTVKALSDSHNMDTAVRGLLTIMNKSSEMNQALSMYTREKQQVDKAIENLLTAIESGIITKSTAQRLKEYEARQEELERLILIEQSKSAIRVSEDDIRKYFEQALRLEPLMLISILIKEVVLFDDRIEIHYTTPLQIGPDESRGFSLFSKNINLRDREMTIRLFIE